MNIEEKIETPYTSSEEVNGSIRFPYFKPFSSSVFPVPDLVTDNDLLGDNKYESHGEVVPKETGQSHYLDPFPQLANDQSGFQQAFHHQATSRITSTDYGTPQAIIYRNPQAAPDISLSDDRQAQYIRREGSLKSQTTILGLPRENNSMAEDLFASWGQLTGPEFRAGYQPSPGSWMATRPFHGNLQSRGELSGRQRIRWTHELHEQFVDAVNNLGGPTKATPKGILKLMKSPGLTVFHIKSHLQKYRSAKCFPNIHEGRNGKSSVCDGMPLCSLRGNGIFHISETLQLQMDVQKSLHEHLEFQKKLQMKIEENANYLQQMLDQQKRSGSYFENHNSNKANEPFLAECSSATVFGTHGEIFLNDHKA